MPEKLSKFLIPLSIVIAGLVIAGAIVYINPSFFKLKIGGVLTTQEAGEKAINFINQNILKDQATASLVGVIEESGLYKLTLKIKDKELTAYITKDGKLLFPGEGISLETQPSQPSSPVKPEGSQNEKQKTSVSTDNEPVIGNLNAPVTIIEFSDFQCPFCAKYETQTFPQLKKDYIDPGKAKIVFKNFPLPFHQFAEKAAEAGECAFEQGKFWEYKEKLFENQQALSVDDLKKYAKDLGLDTGQFNNCLDSGKFAAEVQDDLKSGQEAGVEGTPSFLINGQLLVGAQPFSEFQKIIDEKLK